MKKIRWNIVVACLVTVALLGLVVRRLTSSPATLARAEDVQRAAREVAPPRGGIDERAPLPEGRLVGGSGVVEPREREARVAGSAAGVVSAVKVKEGDRVAAGDVLIELESSVELAAVKTAEAEVASAKASLARSLNGQRAEDREAAAAEAQAASARAELSATALARVEALFRGRALTQEELDKARLSAAADRASAQAADARARAARVGSRREDNDVARAALVGVEARLEQAKATLERRKIRAPYAGEILQVKVRAGEHYTPGQSEAPIVLGDTSRLRARMDVDERDIGKVRVGMPAYVLADAYPGVRVRGTVAEMGRRMGRKNVRTDDPTERIDTKILEVVIDLDPSAVDGAGDTAARLVPGLRVKSYIELGDDQG